MDSKQIVSGKTNEIIISAEQNKKYKGMSNAEIYNIVLKERIERTNKLKKRFNLSEKEVNDFAKERITESLITNQKRTKHKLKYDKT